METRIAYCRHCERNTSVIDTIPTKWLHRNIGWVILLVLFVPIIGLVILCMMFFIPSNNLYCEECGTRVGTKSDAKPICVYCGTKLGSKTAFCPKCGKRYKNEKDSVFCKKCKTENSAKFKYCIKCGAALPRDGNTVTICGKCQTENTLEATYCVKCGAKLPASRRKKSQQTQRTEPVDKQESYGWQYWE